MLDESNSRLDVLNVLNDTAEESIRSAVVRRRQSSVSPTSSSTRAARCSACGSTWVADRPARDRSSFPRRFSLHRSEGVCEDIIMASRLRSRVRINTADEGQHSIMCGGEPCDAVVRGFRAFFDRKLDGLAANGRACADCHMADGQLPALAGQRRRPGFSSCSGGGGGIRMPTIRCSGRSTRMTSGPTARTPAISAIFARTASSGSRSRCRRTSGSSIRRPTSRRRRRKSTCGGAFPP